MLALDSAVMLWSQYLAQAWFERSSLIIKQQIDLVYINGLPAGVTCGVDLFAISDDSVLQREILSVEDCNISNGIWGKQLDGIIPHSAVGHLKTSESRVLKGRRIQLSTSMFSRVIHWNSFCVMSIFVYGSSRRYCGIIMVIPLVRKLIEYWA